MSTSCAVSPLGPLKSILGWRGLLLLLGAALAWHGLRDADWAEAWALLAGIGPFALLVLLVFNLAMLPLMAARWWQLLRILGAPVGLPAVCLYRSAASAVSSLTPGPHCGGEPLSIYLLHRREGIPLSCAATSVALDRILELWASIAVLSGSLILLTIPTKRLFAGGWALPLSLVLLVLLTAFLAALLTGRQPLSRLAALVNLLGRRAFLMFPGVPGPLLDALAGSETRAASLWRQHRGPFLLANLFSVGHWLGVFAEFWVMSALLGRPLAFDPLIAVVLAARLAFLTPLPAGLGVLESVLPWVTASLGLGNALGLSLCLLIRFRDLLFSLAGLGLTLKYLMGPNKTDALARCLE